MTKQNSLPYEKEFSKNALSYNEYNIIQQEVAKKVISLIDFKPQNILDLGCGSGEIYKLIEWDFKSFTAVDISKKMCDLHPKESYIEVINANYEDDELYEMLKCKYFDMVISSSSLQWCSNLDEMAKKISKLSKNCTISLFCDGTFKAIYQTSGLKSFLPNRKEVIRIFEKYFEIEFSIERYKLFFKDNISKFRYIKKSGVSGGKRRLDFKKTKELIKNYPLDYLEFEVIYIKGESLSFD